MENEVDTFAEQLDLIPTDSPLADMCREVVQGEALPMTDSIHIGLEEGLALAVAPVLRVWAGMCLDALRNRKESQEAEYRIAMVLQLQEQGYSQARAERLVEKTLNAVSKRNKDDPAIKHLLQIAKSVEGIHAPSDLPQLTQEVPDHNE